MIMSDELKKLIIKEVGYLAIITKNGFDALDKKIDKEIGELLTEMNGGFEDIKSDINSLDTKYALQNDEMRDKMRVVNTTLGIEN